MGRFELQATENNEIWPDSIHKLSFSGSIAERQRECNSVFITNDDRTHPSCDNLATTTILWKSPNINGDGDDYSLYHECDSCLSKKIDELPDGEYRLLTYDDSKKLDYARAESECKHYMRVIFGFNVSLQTIKRWVDETAVEELLDE